MTAEGSQPRRGSGGKCGPLLVMDIKGKCLRAIFKGLLLLVTDHSSWVTEKTERLNSISVLGGHLDFATNLELCHFFLQTLRQSRY